MKSPAQAEFERHAKDSNFDPAFRSMNKLSMDDMLQSLAALGATKAQELFMRRYAFHAGLNMPRMEYALSVFLDRKLPLIAPGDLKKTGQVDTAARFLGTAPPSRPKVRLGIITFTAMNVVDQTVLSEYIFQARVILEDQGGGFSLDVFGETNKLGFHDEVASDVETQQLIDEAQRTSLVLGNRLVVIACRFISNPPSHAGVGGADDKVRIPFGFTPRDSKHFRQPFVLINTNVKAGDRATLLHEIGHAAGLRHPEDEARLKLPALSFGDPTNIMNGVDPAKPNSTLTVGQGKVLAKAFFATS